MQAPASLVDLSASGGIAKLCACLDVVANSNAHSDATSFSLVFTQPPNSKLNTFSFVTRVRVFSHCGDEALLYALCLLARLQECPNFPPVTPDTLNLSLLGAFLVAAKMLEDRLPRFAHFAEIGCVSAAQLKDAEWFVFKQLGFCAVVSPEELAACHAALVQRRGHARMLPLPRALSRPRAVTLGSVLTPRQQPHQHNNTNKSGVEWLRARLSRQGSN